MSPRACSTGRASPRTQPPVARSQLAAARNPADRRPAAPHPGAQGDRRCALAARARTGERRSSRTRARELVAELRGQRRRNGRCRGRDHPGLCLPGPARHPRPARGRPRSTCTAFPRWSGRRWARRASCSTRRWQHDYSAVIAWLDDPVRARSALDPEGIGETILCRGRQRPGHAGRSQAAAADRAQRRGRHDLHHHGQCACAPGRCFPSEYDKLRADPKKVARRLRRIAALGQPQPDGRARWPRRMSQIDDMVVPAGTRVRADVRRRQPRSALLGRTRRIPDRPRQPAIRSAGAMASTAASAACWRRWRRARCSATIVREVECIELAGTYEPWMTTVGHGPIRQPVKLEFAWLGA